MIAQPARNIYKGVATVPQLCSCDVLECICVKVNKATVRHAWDEHIVAALEEQGGEFDKLLRAVGHAVHQDDGTLYFVAMR